MAKFFVNERFGKAALELLQQAVEIAVRIHQHDRLGVEAQLFQGDHFKDFLKGPKPAGKSDKGVSAFIKPLLPAAHIIGGMHFMPVLSVAVFEEARQDNTDHPPAGGQRGLGYGSHQAGISATID